MRNRYSKLNWEGSDKYNFYEFIEYGLKRRLNSYEVQQINNYLQYCYPVIKNENEIHFSFDNKDYCLREDNHIIERNINKSYFNHIDIILSFLSEELFHICYNKTERKKIFEFFKEFQQYRDKSLIYYTKNNHKCSFSFNNCSHTVDYLLPIILEKGEGKFSFPNTLPMNKFIQKIENKSITQEELKLLFIGGVTEGIRNYIKDYDGCSYTLLYENKQYKIKKNIISDKDFKVKETYYTYFLREGK